MADDKPDVDGRQERTDLTATDYTDWRPNARTMTFGQKTPRSINAWMWQTPWYMLAENGCENAADDP